MHKKGDHLALFLSYWKDNDDKYIIHFHHKICPTFFRDSCSVFTEFQLISHKCDESVYRMNSGGRADVFTDKKEWGFKHFISFNVSVFCYIRD